MKALQDKIRNDQIKFNKKFVSQEKKKVSGTSPLKPPPRNSINLKKYFGQRWKILVRPSNAK